jgi:hypothetical protein
MISGIIASMPLDGGAVDTLATTPGGFPTAIVVDTNRAYWVEQPGDSNPGPLRVLSIGLGGGSPVELARSSPAQFLYASPIKDYGMGLDDTGIYWTNTVDGTVEVIPSDGGSSSIIGRSDAGLASGVAVASGQLFFVGGNGLERVEIASGRQSTVAPSAASHETVSADRDHVYFVVPGSDSTNQVWRAPMDGGTPELLLADMPNIWSVANDEASVFLNVEACGSAPGEILQLRKP